MFFPYLFRILPQWGKLHFRCLLHEKDRGDPLSSGSSAVLSVIDINGSCCSGCTCFQNDFRSCWWTYCPPCWSCCWSCWSYSFRWFRRISCFPPCLADLARRFTIVTILHRLIPARSCVRFRGRFASSLTIVASVSKFISGNF